MHLVGSQPPSSRSSAFSQPPIMLKEDKERNQTTRRVPIHPIYRGQLSSCRPTLTLTLLGLLVIYGCRPHAKREAMRCVYQATTQSQCIRA